MLALASLIFPAFAQRRELGPPVEPGIYMYDMGHMRKVKEGFAAGDKEYALALTQLREDAAEAMKAGPYTVTDKKVTPPSGDKRDYMSQGPYRWPNPKTKNGLPYISKDGQRYPGRFEKMPDCLYMRKMIAAVQTLSVAYYFFDDERYAEHAALLLRTWFVDPKTRVNPNMEYGQMTPGRNNGTSAAIIDAREYLDLIDPLGLLKESRAWTGEDQRQVQLWFDEFLTWFLESSHGKTKFKAEANMGPYYDAQVAAYALIAGKKDIAIKYIENTMTRRMPTHFTAEGEQYRESHRADAWHYHNFQLQAYVCLALMGEHLGIDLWHAQPKKPNAGGLRQAFEYMAPHVGSRKNWPHSHSDFCEKAYPNQLQTFFRIAAKRYDDPEFREIVKNLPEIDPKHRGLLTLMAVSVKNYE